MKRKAKKAGWVARKERPLTQAELKKISAGLVAAANVGFYFRGGPLAGEREFGRDINRGE